MSAKSNNVILLGFYGGDKRVCLSAWQSTTEESLKVLFNHSGIYKILCNVNRKLYIGSSQNIKTRLQTHLSKLKKNKHINPHLQNAYNNYGGDNFTVEVVEFCCIEELLIREQYWMDFYQAYDRIKGFNNCEKADRPLGYKHTDENKARMSDIKKEQLKLGIITSNLTGHTFKEHTQETRNKLSEMRKGELNPRFGHKESEDKKKTRMANMLAQPRWNTGLSAKDDPRLLKLGAHRKGTIPHNALKCKLVDLITGEEWEGKSIKHLSLVAPISLPTLNRLKQNKAGTKMTQRYQLSIN